MSIVPLIRGQDVEIFPHGMRLVYKYLRCSPFLLGPEDNKCMLHHADGSRDTNAELLVS